MKLFPSIYGKIVQVADGFTITVWLFREDPHYQRDLVADEPTMTIETAKGVLSQAAQAHGVSPENVSYDIVMNALGPDGNQVN